MCPQRDRQRRYVMTTTMTTMQTGGSLVRFMLRRHDKAKHLNVAWSRRPAVSCISHVHARNPGIRLYVYLYCVYMCASTCRLYGQLL